MRSEAKEFLYTLRKTHGMFIEPIVLKNSFGDKWQKQAERKIQSSEVVIVFDTAACAESENTQWEINRASDLEKPIISLSRDDLTNGNLTELQSAYEFSNEFDFCFDEHSSDPAQLLELYKIIVASSEQLIQRRQITNGFFFTVVGGFIGALGFLISEGVLSKSNVLVLVFPLAIGLLMCRSWKNLIDNYGKLNTGKFKVIHRIEKIIGTQIFAAEWVALGKGVRKEKYRSFTSTEQIVPTLFSYLLWIAILFTLIIADWKPVIDYIDNIWLMFKGLIF